MFTGVLIGALWASMFALGYNGN